MTTLAVDGDFGPLDRAREELARCAAEGLHRGRQLAVRRRGGSVAGAAFARGSPGEAASGAAAAFGRELRGRGSHGRSTDEGAAAGDALHGSRSGPPSCP